MMLEVYVELVQAQDFSKPITVGTNVSIELIGGMSCGSGSDPGWPLFQSCRGERSLRKTGLVECAFSGDVREIRLLEDFGGQGRGYQEILVDCGLPLILRAQDSRMISVCDLDDPLRGKIEQGRFLSGLIPLYAVISFRYPVLIEAPLVARITSIGILGLHPTEHRLAQIQSVDSIQDPLALKHPLILTIDLPPSNLERG